MNLAAKRCAWLRDDFVMRLGAFLMVIGLLFSLVNPPKAKAIAVVDDILVVASVFFQACGLTWSLQGAMEQSGFTNAVAGLLTDYLAADFAGQTPAQWAGDIGASIAPGGKLMIPKLLAQKLGAFANWVVQKKAITAGGPNISINGDASLRYIGTTPVTFTDFDSFDFSTVPLHWIDIPSDATESNKFYFADGNSYFYYTDDFSGCTVYYHWSGLSYNISKSKNLNYPSTGLTKLAFVFVSKANDFVFYPITYYPGSGFSAGRYCWKYLLASQNPRLQSYYNSMTPSAAVALHPAAAIDIPDTSTMADNESIAIDTAITAGTTAELLQRILDAIMAGTLTATKEIAKVEPKPGEITDVNELGLPSLAAIITTRFPFSIPWDVVKGFKLLSAPAKTPHWEVDFYGAVSGMVPGGWKGDTRIVIDFSKFEVLGQLSRWTSTIGFCLFLAMGTKKLSWVS